MQRQRRSASSDTPASRRPRRRLVPFTASVRLADGTRNIYEVSNAQNEADARRMILEEVENVVAVMIVVRG
jgi:hypothetical protein